METCKDAVIEAVKELGGVVTPKSVADYIYRKYPDKPWKENSIYHHLVGLSVNHPSAKHHPHLQKQAFLFYLGNGRYKLYEPKKDGEATNPPEDESQGIEYEEAFEATISLERDLEEHIARNLNQIEKGLKLYMEEGISGRQFSTDVGRIDLLTLDKDGNFVVIELKAGTATHSVIGQILGYMSWIRQNISGSKKVRGIVIADNFDEKSKYAALETPNISLEKYEVNFSFKNVDLSE